MDKPRADADAASNTRREMRACGPRMTKNGLSGTFTLDKLTIPIRGRNVPPQKCRARCANAAENWGGTHELFANSSQYSTHCKSHGQ